MLGYLGLTHKEGYRFIFVTSVLFQLISCGTYAVSIVMAYNKNIAYRILIHDFHFKPLPSWFKTLKKINP